MTTNTPRRADHAIREFDQGLTALVDAIVQAIDAHRWAEIDRVRSALEPFGGTTLFDAELRLNGTASIGEFCICGGDDL